MVQETKWCDKHQVSADRIKCLSILNKTPFSGLALVPDFLHLRFMCTGEALRGKIMLASQRASKTWLTTSFATCLANIFSKKRPAFRFLLNCPRCCNKHDLTVKTLTVQILYAILYQALHLVCKLPLHWNENLMVTCNFLHVCCVCEIYQLLSEWGVTATTSDVKTTH